MAISLTNQWVGGQTAGSSFGVTIANAGGPATVLVASIAVYEAAATQYITAVSDNSSGGSNTWTYIGAGASGSGHSNTEMWVCLSPKACTTVTFTISVSVAAAVNVSEYGGFAGTPSIDVSAAGESASANPVAGGALTTTAAGDLVVGCIGYGTAASVVYSIDNAASTPSSGWTGLTREIESAMSVSGAYGVVASAQSILLEWSQSPTGSQTIGWCVVAFKAGATAATVIPPSNVIQQVALQRPTIW